jgi:hypothetical protein
VYLGATKPKEGEDEQLTPEEENDWMTNGGWSEGQSNSLVYAAEKGKIKKVLLCATGALLSTISSGQGESIPCITHAVAIERLDKE